MNRLKEKLRSEGGASLLIALLVFLLCILVAATVLAAAVSNAGRAKSNRAEQQRYQTLSSAMRLICGELEKTEYTGKYKYYTWDNGGVNYYYCEQASGEIAMQTVYNAQTFKLTDFPFMAADGSLTKEMDDVFRKSFLDGSGGGKTGYRPLAESEVTTASSPVYLTVTLPPNLPGYPYAAGSTAFGEYKIPKTAKVKIELGDHNPQNIKLKLTGWLDDTSGTTVPASGSGIMVAELKAEVKEETEAGVWTEYDVLEPHLPSPAPSPGTFPAPDYAVVKEKTVSVTWKLDNIRMTTAP